MKRVWAVVPVKAFARGKSRLASVLDDAARAAFARGLLEHVLGALRESGVVAGTLVATDADEVAEVARAFGAEVKKDAGASGTLAAVIDAGLVEVAARGADAALVLMADLPKITADDVRVMVAALGTHQVVIAADRHGTHTNALGLAPPARLATSFGTSDSFRRHVAAASAAGAYVAVIENERIAFDVDEPEDHDRV